MKLTQNDIDKKRMDALCSPSGEDFARQGFSFSEIEEAVCVFCGNIDGNALRSSRFPNAMTAPKSGRYVIQSKRRNYDAGHICAKCMSQDSPK